MALSTAGAALAFLIATGAASVVAVGAINLVKTRQAEKDWNDISTRLTAAENSSDISDLKETIDKNNNKLKQDKEKSKEKIELIEKEVQLKKDIEALQAQIEQAQKDLGTAKTQKTKLEKAIHTLNEMKVELDAVYAAGTNTNADVAAILDQKLWSPFFTVAGAAPVFNNGAAGELVARKNEVLDACADVDGERDGHNLAAATNLKVVLALLADTDATAGVAGVGNPASKAEKVGPRNFLERTFRPELQEQVDSIKRFKKAIAKTTADLKAKENELAALQKKNK